MHHTQNIQRKGRKPAVWLGLIMASLFSQYVAAAATVAAPSRDPKVAQLAKEVGRYGWVSYSALTDKGDWELFVMRPDGSDIHNISHTPEYNEIGPRFSHDGKRLLYRRLPKAQQFNHDNWGALGQLVISDANGSNARALGKNGELLWASWGPDDKELATLNKKGIEFWDVQKNAIVRSIPRKGIYQQLYWSPDGQWMTGPANTYGEQWTVVRMKVASGEVNPVNSFQNCTPDWFPDSKRIIFSHRPKDQGDDGGLAESMGFAKNYGWTQLWKANGDGTDRQVLYGEDGRHVYGGQVSPDNRYVLFTTGTTDGGEGNEAGAVMHLMRLSDAPIVTGKSIALRRLQPKAKAGPVLNLPRGWEPFWTAAEITFSR